MNVDRELDIGISNYSFIWIVDQDLLILMQDNMHD